MLSIRLSLSLYFLLLPFISFCQAPSFNMPDTICTNTATVITNTSTGGHTWYWNFCMADLMQTPEAVNLGNLGNYFSQPVFIDICSQGGNYYGLVVNHYPGGLVRLDFGNSLLNTPVATDLGNFGGIINAGYGSEGIQIANAGGNWTALIIGGNPAAGGTPRLVKVDFGTDITNPAPIATNWGDLGNTVQAIDLYLFQESGKWHAYTVSAVTNAIVRFDFGADFINPPTAVNLGNPGNSLDYPTGICPVNDGGNWRLFITNGATPASIVRLDFGGSLLNTPVVKPLGNPQNVITSARSIRIIQLCDQVVGFVTDGNANTLVQLDFHNDLTSIPTATSLGNLASFNFPHSLSKLFRVGADLYSFIPNAYNNTMSRIKFAGCTNSSLPNSTAPNPPPVSYAQPGTYHVNLIMDDGLPTQNSFCRNITVVAPPSPAPDKITSDCADCVVLVSRFTTPSVWSDGSTASSLTVRTSGAYSVSTSYYGCSAHDNFSITLLPPVPFLWFGNDSSLCEKDSVILKGPQGVGLQYNWQDGSADPELIARTTGQYQLTVTNSDGCHSEASVNLSFLSRPEVASIPDRPVCKGTPLILATTVRNYDSLRWTPAVSLSSATATDPMALPSTDTRYIVTAYHSTCAVKDTVDITVLPEPDLQVSPDATICTGSSIQLRASGTDSYSWSPADGLSDPLLSEPVASPGTTTVYHVLATNNSTTCTKSDSVRIRVKPPETFHISPDESNICSGDTLYLKITGGEAATGDYYDWHVAGVTPDSVLPVVPDNTTTYQAIAYDNICRRQTPLTAYVAIRPKPVTSLSKSNDIDCVLGEAQLTASGGIRYWWEPGSTLSDPGLAQPIARTDTTTLYRVTVFGANGCRSIDTIRLVVSKTATIGFPVANAFTPNGDGYNDCFGIKYWGYIGHIEMSIFNRWGQQVFYTEDPGGCWDGTYKGKAQPSGAYVCIIKAATLCGVAIKKGTLLLIR
jgi:gliding motility-associated-like protein